MSGRSSEFDKEDSESPKLRVTRTTLASPDNRISEDSSPTKEEEEGFAMDYRLVITV